MKKIYTILFVSFGIISASLFLIAINGSVKDRPQGSSNVNISKTKSNALHADKSDISRDRKRYFSKKADFYYLYSSAVFDIQDRRLSSAEKKLEMLQKLQPKSTAVLLSLAKVYIQQQRYQDAQKVIDSAIKFHPGQHEAWRMKGILNLEKFRKSRSTADLIKVKEAFSKVIQLNPKDTNEMTLRILAMSFLEEGNKEKGIEYLEKLMKHHPSSMLGFTQLEKLYQEKKDERSLLKLYKTLTEYFPEDLEIQTRVADIAFRLRRYDDAEIALTAILEEIEKLDTDSVQKPKLAAIYRQLGFIYLRKNKLDLSLQYFTKSREIVNDIFTNVFLVIALIQQENYQTARHELDIALKEFKSSKRYNELRVLNAQLFQKEGKTEVALKEVDKLIAENQDNIDYKVNKATLYFDTREYEKCEEYSLALYKQYPSEARVLFQLGSATERLGKFNEAEKYFKLALKLDPQNSSVMNYLGYMWADKGINLNEAENLIKKALELDPTSSAYLDSLGWVYYKMGKYAKARYFLEKAVTEGVDNGEIFDHMGDLYYKMEMFEEAYESWKKSLHKDDPNIDHTKIMKKIKDVEKKLKSTR